MNEWLNWRELLPHAVWAVLGGTGVYVWNWVRRTWKRRGQRALLAGLEGETLFVFPPRPGQGQTLVPRMAIEDFLAINNIISAFIRADLTPPDKVRDTEHLTRQDRERNNLVVICSSKSNQVTREVLDALRHRSSRLRESVPYFHDVPDAPGEIEVRWGKGEFRSESYKQAREDAPRRHDIAIIVKAQNPWSSQHKVLVVAGTRGFGTWGAAELLKKWWKPLERQLRRQQGHKRGGDYAALVSVHYQDLDIKGARLEHLPVSLESAYADGLTDT